MVFKAQNGYRQCEFAELYRFFGKYMIKTENVFLLSSTRRTETPAKYISIKASSTELCFV